jgi:hypothetical protein
MDIQTCAQPQSGNPSNSTHTVGADFVGHFRDGDRPLTLAEGE